MLKYNLYDKAQLADAIAHAQRPIRASQIKCYELIFIPEDETNTEGYVDAKRYAVTDEGLVAAGFTDTGFYLSNNNIDANKLHFDFIPGGIKCWFYDADMIVDGSLYSTTRITVVPRH